jgi:hypothetical protein
MSDDQSGVDEQKVIDVEAAPLSKSDKDKRRAAEELASNKQAQGSMRVKVHSPFRDYYDGPALSVSAENATGPFDILPRHHNFISLLIPCELVIRTIKKGEQRIRISGGLMHVKANQIIVFLDI